MNLYNEINEIVQSAYFQGVGDAQKRLTWALGMRSEVPQDELPVDFSRSIHDLVHRIKAENKK